MLLRASNKTLNIFSRTDAINLKNFGKFTDYFLIKRIGVLNWYVINTT